MHNFHMHRTQSVLQMMEGLRNSLMYKSLNITSILASLSLVVHQKRQAVQVIWFLLCLVYVKIVRNHMLRLESVFVGWVGYQFL